MSTSQIGRVQEILTGMAEMPPSPILSSPGTTLITSQRPASERHPPAGAGETTGAGATGQGQCFGHYRAEEHNYHCFVDTMHTKILVNNEINESEKSRQYFRNYTYSAYLQVCILFLQTKNFCR